MVCRRLGGARETPWVLGPGLVSVRAAPGQPLQIALGDVRPVKRPQGCHVSIGSHQQELPSPPASSHDHGSDERIESGDPGDRRLGRAGLRTLSGDD